MLNTYLPAFRAAVVEGKAELRDVCLQLGERSTRLRQRGPAAKAAEGGQWGFQGYVVSDCGAVGDIYRSHKYTATQGAASVAAVKAGTDLTCGGE